MKPGSYIFIFAIASLSVLGWWDHRRLAALQHTRDGLSARAVKLGIPMETASVTQRPRPDRAAAAKLAAARFIKHHKDREAVKLAGGDPDKSPETAATAFHEWMAPLDSRQIRVVIGEILKAPDIDDKSRRRLMGTAVSFLRNDDPAGALSLFSEFSHYLEDTGIGRQTVRESLGALAKEDPHAAIAWARDHADEFPGFNESARDVLISNIALQDPALAFEIIRDFGTQRQPGDAEATILRSYDPEMRTMAFTAFRQHRAAMDDANVRKQVEQRAWAGLAQGIAYDGFEAGSKWLLSVNPTPDELSGVLQRMGLGFANSNKSDDIGHWLEWTAEILPAGDGQECILDMVKYWTQIDVQSAGQWITARPDSAMKQTAVRAYAEALARTEPETAAQWALTLPPGKDREQTLKNIHQNWPKADHAGAAEFANEHGIGK